MPAPGQVKAASLSLHLGGELQSVEYTAWTHTGCRPKVQARARLLPTQEPQECRWRSAAPVAAPVTKVGVTDLRGVVRRTGRLHGDNTGLVISPHRFLFWDCTLVTYSVYPRNKKCLQHGEFLLTFPPRSPLLLRAGFRKTSL